MDPVRISLAFVVFWGLVVAGAFLTVSAGPLIGVIVVALGLWAMFGVITALVRTHPA